MEFFRIFELIVIAGILYIIWRFLTADARLLKKRMDAKLNQDQEQGEPNARTKPKTSK